MFASATRRRLTRLVWALAIGLTIIIGYDAYHVARAARFNELLQRGELADSDYRETPEGRFAAAYTLQQQRKFREAMRAYIVAGDGAGAKLEAAIKFNLANLYLEYASSLGDASDLTVPLIELAKENYRDLLRADNRDWDAKYNLEFALALLPEPEEVNLGEELMPEHSRRSLAVRDIEEQLP